MSLIGKARELQAKGLDDVAIRDGLTGEYGRASARRVITELRKEGTLPPFVAKAQEVRIRCAASDTEQLLALAHAAELLPGQVARMAMRRGLAALAAERKWGKS